MPSAESPARGARRISGRDSSKHKDREVARQPDGIGRLLSAIAIYPLLAFFRFLTKFTAEKVFAGNSAGRANAISQDMDKPANRPRNISDGPGGSAATAEIGGSPLPDRDSKLLPPGDISFDGSFSGAEPTSPKPAGKRRLDSGLVQLTLTLFGRFS